MAILDKVSSVYKGMENGNNSLFLVCVTKDQRIFSICDKKK